MMQKFKTIFFSSIGNVLEWYDFGLFTIFSAVFCRLFFPPVFTHAAFMATLGVFAVGFICRPLGALIFGYLGDRYGRVKTLRYSILMISLPTFIIGLLPTFQEVGILAPILLLITRMWQGISIGGEYSGNVIYLAESAPAKHRAFFSSFASIGANLGLLLAATIGFIMTKLFDQTTLLHVGWRIPYLLGGVLSLVIFALRLKLNESKVFIALRENKTIVTNPIVTVFKDEKSQVLRTLGLVTMGSTFYYFAFAYIPIFLTQNSTISIQSTSLAMTVLLVVMMLIAPIGGFICDRVGRRNMLLFNATLVLCLIIPGFYYLQESHFTFIVLILLAFAIASALEQGSTPAAIVENFPAGSRYTGVSFGYNIGNGLLGGTVPFICEWLFYKTGMPILPAFYISLCAMITLSVVYFFIPKGSES